MGGRGPRPTNNPHSRRTDKFIELPAAKVEIPDIPAGDWLPQTVEWWKSWCAAPQASQFPSTTWQRLKMLIILVDRYFLEGSNAVLTEIRHNEKSLGAMPDDMQRLRWQIAGSGPDDEPATKKRSKRGKDPRKSYLKSV